MAGTRIPPSNVFPLPTAQRPDAPSVAVGSKAVIGRCCASRRPHHRPVVGREHDERPLGEPERGERVEDLAGAPVELLDGVAIDAPLRAAGESRGGILRDMRHRVGQVEEEGPVLVLVNESYGALGVAQRQPRLIDGSLDDAVAIEQRQRPEPEDLLERLTDGPLDRVVGVGQPEVLVEALRWAKRSVPAEVPLADARRGIAMLLEQLGQSDLARRQPRMLGRK